MSKIDELKAKKVAAPRRTVKSKRTLSREETKQLEKRLDGREWRPSGGFAEKYTPDMVADALQRCMGNVSATARSLKCSNFTIYRYIDKYPEVQKVHEELTGGYTKLAHAVVVDAIEQGEVDPAKWYLSRRDPRFQKQDETRHVGEVVFRVVYDSPDPKPSTNGHVVEGTARELTDGHGR